MRFLVAPIAPAWHPPPDPCPCRLATIRRHAPSKLPDWGRRTLAGRRHNAVPVPLHTHGRQWMARQPEHSGSGKPKTGWSTNGTWRAPAEWLPYCASHPPHASRAGSKWIHLATAWTQPAGATGSGRCHIYIGKVYEHACYIWFIASYRGKRP